MTEPRDVIKVTMTKEERREIELAAKSEGMQLSTFMRVVSLRAARQ